ncbi:glycosyltransferase [bacterium]|nr:glycosyltransferase [bacterium]
MTFKNEVFSLWIGPRLSILEQTCINSFLEKGIVFILYIYNNLENVPQGTVIRDANTVILEEEYSKYDNPSYFSNLFRYTLLYELGGIWVDMDLVCIQPIDLSSEYIFSSELKNDEQHTNAGIIGCPPKTTLMYDCKQEVQNIVHSKQSIKHGQLGPKVLKKYVSKHELEHYVLPPYVFCYYGFREVHTIFTSIINHIDELEDATCIHLWNNVLSKEGIDKTVPLKNTLYDNLTSLYTQTTTINVTYKAHRTQEQSTLNLSVNSIFVAYSEAEAFSLKQQNPSSYIVLIKKRVNAFLVYCNKLNTHVYEYTDKIILEEQSKFNILKSVLKK